MKFKICADYAIIAAMCALNHLVTIKITKAQILKRIVSLKNIPVCSGFSKEPSYRAGY